MEDNFIKIAITRPEFFSREAALINEILKNDMALYVHIRKPFANKEEIKNLIKEINPEFHCRLKLHDHFELMEDFALGGIHLNSRNPESYPDVKSISISYHSINEINKMNVYDYFFISPIFDSISKKGYKAAFDLEELSKIIKGKNAIALGGVTPKKFPLLKKLGFSGAALLSHFFPDSYIYK